MAQTVPLGEYRPDVSDLDAQFTQIVSNCVPRADGYGPMQALAGFSAALAAQCRGYFCARNYTDSTVVIFAATATKLYKLNNTTFAWIDVSKAGGSYSAVNSNANWSFAQFGNDVIAVQANIVPQVFNVHTASAFADLGGSPPQAAYVSVVGDFVVLSGLTSNPNRVFWSGIGNDADWTAGDVNSSDFQDLPDGGAVDGVIGAQNVGIIIQDSAIRSMVFSPGSAVIFDIYKLAKDIGCIAPWSIANEGSKIIFLSQLGWVMTDFNGAIDYIGKEKIDRTFLANWDSSNSQLVISTFDPANSVFWIIFKSATNSTTYCDQGLVYHWIFKRWAPFTCSMEYINYAVQPGITLEALDAVAPGNMAVTGAASNGGPNLIRIQVASTSTLTTGQTVAISGVGGTTEANNTATNGWWTITVIDATHFDLQNSVFTHAYTSGGIVAGSIDALAASLDSYTTNFSALLSGVDNTHTLGFFSGANLQATFETMEMSGAATLNGQRILFKGCRPVTDATSVLGQIGYRENLMALRSYTAQVPVDRYGYLAEMQSTRYARARLTIPSATTWTFCTGVQPDMQGDGYA